MKLLSEHLGETIVAIAVVVVLITSVALFRAPIGDFFTSITSDLLEVDNGVSVTPPDDSDNTEDSSNSTDDSSKALPAPNLSITGDTIFITDTSGNAESAEILANGETIGIASFTNKEASYSMGALLNYGSHNIKVILSAPGFVSSEATITFNFVCSHSSYTSALAYTQTTCETFRCNDCGHEWTEPHTSNDDDYLCDTCDYFCVYCEELNPACRGIPNEPCGHCETLCTCVYCEDCGELVDYCECCRHNAACWTYYSWCQHITYCPSCGETFGYPEACDIGSRYYDDSGDCLGDCSVCGATHAFSHDFGDDGTCTYCGLAN